MTKPVQSELSDFGFKMQDSSNFKIPFPLDYKMSEARRGGQSGQAAVELALQIPLMLVLLFGTFQIARIFYVYHTLEKALRGGAGILTRSVNVNYCDASDPTLADARNLMVYGNIQGEGTAIVQGFTPDMIQILPERSAPGSTALGQCPCTEDTDSCDVSTGGSPPDFVVVNLVSGFPLQLPFPYVKLSTINLKVSVRMPVTGS